ncbi:MAG TPA: multicopper oxidase domain-containing protein [Longimicrobiales bacterium]|nr:multicopper oxidase domain-containing protein [Longimicrobiales bacterium]
MRNKDEDDRAERSRGLTRRDLLRAGVAGAAGLTAASPLVAGRDRVAASVAAQQTRGPSGHDAHDMSVVGDIRPGGFDPVAYLKEFDTGRVSTLPSGQTLREYDMVAVDREIEVAPGVFFPAWTYNGSVPGPTIRCTEGDRVRVRFVNGGSHPHTIHFHGIHAADMDGVFEMVEPGQTFMYEFDAEPFGLHLYHCHAIPLKRHIHKGLYGVFLVDPPQGRAPANEMVMVMNGFDTNFDGDNEVYAVNTVGFHYQRHPIVLRRGELNRVYLVNITEFDLINSFHLHGNFFRSFRTGTNLEHHEFTDNLMLCQGERAVLEFTFNHTGRFMFHAHQSEFAELGWMGIFDVREALNA